MFTDDVVDFAVSGDAPCAVDMPVGWAHNITNTGDEVLVTQFWSHELFRPEAPDTFPHPVHAGGKGLMLKVMTVVGTRPELIRLSRVIHRLDATVDHVLVHTGQNYDYALNEVFFRDLGIREPDHMLGVDTSSLGAVLGRHPHRCRAGHARGAP